jgi:hypothetical protein
MFYSVPTNHNCLCVYSESVPRSRATVTNMYNLMHMWHHVTNHLIISNDKDSNSENRIKLRVRDSDLMVIHASATEKRIDLIYKDDTWLRLTC